MFIHEDIEYTKKLETYQEVWNDVVFMSRRGKLNKEQLKVNQKTGKIVKNNEIKIGNYTQKVSNDEPWKKFSKKYGNREQVFNDISFMTKSKLKKEDLILNIKAR